MEYHTELTAEQRREVDTWLASVFGPRHRELRIWRYEVVGEGLVEFHRFSTDLPLRFIEFTAAVKTPPPIVRGVVGDS